MGRTVALYYVLALVAGVVGVQQANKLTAGELKWILAQAVLPVLVVLPQHFITGLIAFEVLKDLDLVADTEKFTKSDVDTMAEKVKTATQIWGPFLHFDIVFAALAVISGCMTCVATTYAVDPTGATIPCVAFRLPIVLGTTLVQIFRLTRHNSNIFRQLKEHGVELGFESWLRLQEDCAFFLFGRVITVNYLRGLAAAGLLAIAKSVSHKVIYKNGKGID